MKPVVLAADTTSEMGSLALLEGEELVAEVPLRSADGYGHLIFPAIEALLSRCGRKLSEVDCFCAASGPGSFTGIRVGLAAIQGLADALSKPAAAVSTLRAMAWHGSADLRAPVIDARRGEVYAGLYSRSLAPLRPETVAGPEAWLASLPAGRVEILCRDERAAAVLDAVRPAISGSLGAVPAELAGAVARIAAAALLEGGLPPLPVEANYVRRSDAEMFWREW